VERALTLAACSAGTWSPVTSTAGTLAASADPGDGGRVLTFEVPAGFERWLVDKGSVASTASA
jgi:hypothetical protein